MSDHLNTSEAYAEIQELRGLLSKLIKSLQTHNRRLAKAEYEYRKSLTKTIFTLNQEGFKGEIDGETFDTNSVAWTASEKIARGIPEVADLRLERDTLQGEVDAIMQKIYQVKTELNLLDNDLQAIRKGD